MSQFIIIRTQEEKITDLDVWDSEVFSIYIDEQCSGYRLPTLYEYRWANIGAHRSSGYPNYGAQKKEWDEKRFPGDPGKGKGSLEDYPWYQGNSGGKLKASEAKEAQRNWALRLSGKRKRMDA